MFSRLRHGRGVPLTALVLGVGFWSFTGAWAMAQGEVPHGAGLPATALAVTGIPTALRDAWDGGPIRWNPYSPPAAGYEGMGTGVLNAWSWEQHMAFDYGRHHAEGLGTHGYATSGNGDFAVLPGFAGFGMSFHRGYGYGGNGLGVGADGGYPYYGGPGYPCGGYLYPGPMFVSDGAFGPFTGPPPYPEATFAPYTAAAATTGSASGMPFDPFTPSSVEGALPPSATVPRGPTVVPSITPHGRVGIQSESFVDPNGVRVLKITSVTPTSPADQAGLQAGDVILSVNGFRTEEPGHLVWIVANQAPNRLLTMNVRNISDGKEHSVLIQLPAIPVDPSRPPYLPPAGSGPPPASR
jgi:PDZ domain